jgi:hypothetical protein
LRAFPKRENASLTLIQGRNRCIEAKIRKCLIFASIHPIVLKRWGATNVVPNRKNFFLKNDFRFNTPISSLNQGQGSAFTVRECAQSIPRLEKPKNRRFSHKNPKMFDFRFNTPAPIP